MAENKKAILLYCDLIDIVSLMKDAEAGRLFKHFLAYTNDINAIAPDRLTRIIFEPIKHKIISGKLKIKSGESHWNWKGGKTSENKKIRNGTEIKEWRKIVFERDEYTCQNCKTKGGTLHAHHICHFSKFLELRFEINNGLALCKSCHKAAHRK